MAWLLAQGCQIVVVTLGPDGAVFTSFSDGVHGAIPAPKVVPVDTTGTGDCFVGRLGVSIAEGLDLESAVRRRAKVLRWLGPVRALSANWVPW
jgi:ribokinase